MPKYTTQEGQLIDQIAHIVYGDSRQQDLLFEANPVLANHVILPAGIVLDVPPTPKAKETTGIELWS